MGITGVWLAIPLAELCTFAIALALVLNNNKKYHYIA
jgi:Na+-driven multidrug efflux pump